MTPDPIKAAASQLRRDVDREVVQAWLDALSTGGCDEEEFLRAVEKLTRRSAEVGWDSLALLDQYYRLGKIPTEVFGSIKSRLGSQLVGVGPDGELSVPLPQSGDLEPLPTAPPHSSPAQPTSAQPVAAPRVVPPPAANAPAKLSATKPAAPAPNSPPPTAAASTARPPAATGQTTSPASRPASTPQPAPSAPAPAAKQVSHLAVQTSAPASAADGPAHARENAPSQPNPAARGVELLRRSTRREIAVGEVLRGRYVIKSVLGRGGTGLVFEAADQYRIDMPESGQRVALKVLHGQISGRPELLAELQREFQLLQSLSHPSIVRAYDLDRDGDIAFFTMEYLRGLSLTGVLAARNQVPFERAHALAIIRDVGAAVAHAHSRAVVHGDLNPGNIFITNEGEIRVLDFGAARVSHEGPTVSAAAPPDRAPIATPRYASAQVLDGKRPDARDDVYSLACLAYVLLGGKHPFGDRTALGAQEQRVKPSRPNGVTGKEWRALRAGLAFDRERRPSDVALWLEAFDWSEAAPRLPPLVSLVRAPARRGRRWAVPALGAAAVIAALAAVLWASGYFDANKRTLTIVPSEPEPQSDAPQPPSDRSGSAAQQTQQLRSAAARRPDRPTTASSPPAPDAAASASPRPSSTANAPARLAATTRGAGPVDVSAQTSNPGTAQVVPAGTGNPSALPRSRVELAADTIDVPLTDPAARIVVRRRGSLQGNATFTWWTESGTAKPGQDFMAVAPHQEVIEDGKSSVNLFIPVVGDATRQQPKSFYVVINDPGEGVTLGARTLTMVTIPPSQ